MTIISQRTRMRKRRSIGEYLCIAFICISCGVMLTALCMAMVLTQATPHYSGK